MKRDIIHLLKYCSQSLGVLKSLMKSNPQTVAFIVNATVSLISAQLFIVNSLTDVLSRC